MRPAVAAWALAAVCLWPPVSCAGADGGATLFQAGVPGRVQACSACHGRAGEGGAGGAPYVAGMPRRYVERQLKAFAAGRRPGAVMAAVAGRLTAEEVGAVSRTIASLPPVRRPAGRSGVQPAGAAALVTMGAEDGRLPGCVDCHGPALMGGGPDIPPLAGQNPGYVAAELRAFRSGRRDAGPLGLMGRIARRMTPDDIREAAGAIAAMAPGGPVPVTAAHRTHRRPPPPRQVFAPPPETAMPQAGPYAAAVRLGERIFDDTPRFAARYTGSALSCRNCHLQRGRSARSAPVWAAVVRYPRYRSKSGKVVTLQMRLQGCFRYSENGSAPPADGTVMVALTAYLHWLATGLPVGVQPPAAGLRALPAPPAAPDRSRGRAVYEADCRLCHGGDGQGRVVAGRRVFPPLWGPASYNGGAGMHRIDKAAAFIAGNMPFSRGGMLSVQQAWDVAAYIDSRPRPRDPRRAGGVRAP